MCSSDLGCKMKQEQKKISKELQARLSKAYMNLYNTLVQAYQSKGNPRGQSQFNAISVLREIMSLHAQNQDAPAISFLTKLFNTHKGIVAKNTMLSDNKDVLEPIEGDFSEKVNSAITNLELEISRAKSDETQNLTETTLVLKHCPPIKRGRNFYDWVNATATEADINKLENDPAFFGKLYNKYIMRQHHK